MKRNSSWLATWTVLVLFAAVGLAPVLVFGGEGNAEFTQDFFIEDCTFSTTGTNPFFILKPGARLVLAGFEGKEYVELTITVLNEKKMVGGINTRVVREEETKDGVLVEVSRNYFASCNERNDVFYFGEDVDICDEGLVSNGHGGFTCNGGEPSHAGKWLAFQRESDNMPGIIMPGTILLGSRYFQEIAPDVAMDRAEHLAMDEKFAIDEYESFRCLKVEETTPLEPNAKGIKVYCPGIGLVKDGTLVLTEYSGL